MTALTLTPAERREHKARAHHLNPVVIIGGDGLTPPVIREIDLALNAHQLIKVRAFCDDRQQRESLLSALCDQLNAAPIQHIGKLLVLWRPAPPKITTDAHPATRPGPRTRPTVVTVVKPSKSPNHRPIVKKVRVLGNQRITQGGTLKRAKPRTSSIKKRSV